MPSCDVTFRKEAVAPVSVCVCYENESSLRRAALAPERGLSAVIMSVAWESLPLAALSVSRLGES